jgi:hypothetical protein
MEDKINKIDNNKDIISLINIYGSELKPDKLIKYRPFKPNFNRENPDKENELTLKYQIIMAMKPFIKDLCPNFDIELETKKQEMRELTKKILNNKDGNATFSDNDKNKLLEYINEEWGQKYFLSFLTMIRTTGHYCRSEKLVKILAEIFNKILNIAEKKVDYDIVKNCIILSQTYYYEDKNKSKRVYLVELICDNKWLRTPDFWRNIIDIMIKEDIKKIKQMMNQKDENEGIINVVFAQVISYINNMKDFKLENKIIVKIVDEFVEKYNIGKDLSKHIYDNIDKSNEIENLRKQYKNEDENINKNGINY